ncbi:MAG: rod-binding protein [Arcobacteraceae bacterium]
MINVDTTFVNTTKYDDSALKQLKTKNMQDENLRNVCNDFESFFTQQFLDVSLKESKLAGEGTGSEIIKGLYTEALSKNASGTFGISDMLYKFLSENNK